MGSRDLGWKLRELAVGREGKGGLGSLSEREWELRGFVWQGGVGTRWPLLERRWPGLRRR